jgi:hypothetical protein
MKTHNACLSVFVAVTAITVGACDRAPDPAKVSENVARAQAAGQKRVADAQQRLDQVTRDIAAVPASDTAASRENAAANDKIADARYGVDKAQAEANYDVARAQCGGQAGEAQKTCEDSARAAYDSSLAAAKAKNEQARKRSAS